MERISTASTGPMEQSAIRPKLFSPASRPPRVCAMPSPRAMMKGTVMGPVVTPPESKDRGRKDCAPPEISRDENAKRSM